MRTLRLLAATAAAVWMGAGALAAHADTNPAVVSLLLVAGLAVLMVGLAVLLLARTRRRGTSQT